MASFRRNSESTKLREHESTIGVRYPSYPRSLSQNGYTLYLVLLLLSISAILLSVTMLDINFIQKQSTREIHKIQAKALAESGIARAEYFLNGGDGHGMDWETDLYEEVINGYGLIRVTNKRFGLFTRIISKGIRLRDTCTISGLFGREIPEILTPSLTLTGHVGGLVLKDGSSVEGSIVLHHGEIYREKRGRPLSEYRNRLIIRESPSLPFDSTLIPELFDKLGKKWVISLSEKGALAGNLYLTNPEDSLLKKDEITVLGNCYISSGPVCNKKISISGNLYLQKGSVISESEIYAEKITIEEGNTDKSLFYSPKNVVIKSGRHNSQFFFLGSILISNGAEFGKLNAVVSLRRKSDENKVNGGIFIEEGSLLKGTLISCLDSSAEKIITGPSIVIRKRSKISGVIITDQDLEINGVSISGNVWARSVVTRNDKHSFVNYLLLTSIESIESNLIFPIIGGQPVGPDRVLLWASLSTP